MRVIAGEYRGRTLKSPPSLDVRPTADRLRETLFNVLAPRIVDARCLDLCAGTGAIGIEALSRGASFVTFVERSRKMCALVEENLDLCRVEEERSEVVMSDAADFLRRAHRKSAAGKEGGIWDVVFYDPPYASDYLPVLGEFRVGEDATSLLKPDGVLIVEHHHKKPLPESLGDVRRWRVIKQGDAALSFYQAA
ncbi:MAG: 16S rRNA (guanine(966)-N(2))-methyltransferase RsmD [Pyrinomonadaceae bacterium MAG19_C2-C3]|nr:16S rRNA (guanine(966)-N(2))-methyltransferase RsmD [Pyrinomonadaceae bacterium MAG19_C2-C3]